MAAEQKGNLETAVPALALHSFGPQILLLIVHTFQVAFLWFHQWWHVARLVIALALLAGAITALNRSGRLGWRHRTEPPRIDCVTLPPAEAIQLLNIGFFDTALRSTTSVADIDSTWLKGCRQVAATRERFQQLCASRATRVSSPTVADLEQALQQRVCAYELHHRNWRNRVYRVELENGMVLFLKQVSFGTDATVRGQLDELEALGRLQVPGLRVPRPVALLAEKRVLIMEFVTGETITALLSSRAGTNHGLRACELAGAVLARIHRAWRERVCPLPVEQLAEDIATVPWRLSRGQKEILGRLLAEITGARVSVGRMHYDYEPDNLLLHGEQLFLVDPSAGSHWGVQLFEVATFHNALRRRLCMRWMRRPSGWRPGLLGEGIDRFDKGYLGQSGAADLEPKLFTLAIRFFELQRLGQIFVSQEAKIDMARHTGEFGWEAGGPSMNRAQFGLLNVYKGWLFRQLARELPS